MSNLFPFMQRLSLDGNADVSAIRRAYARELKRIDQASDAAGFQLLREAYETALHWHKNKPASAEIEAGPADRIAAPATGETEKADSNADPKPASTPVSAPVSMADLFSSWRATPADSTGDTRSFPDRTAHEIEAEAASVVFNEYIKTCSDLFKENPQENVKIAETALRRCMADPRLDHFQTRHLFQQKLIDRLAAGWQPANEYYFHAAEKIWSWSEDRKKLQEFGAGGARVDRAVNEQLVAMAQTVDIFEVQKNAVRRLRDPRPPDKWELKQFMPSLQILNNRFPHWLVLLSDTGNLSQWFHAYETLSESTRESLEQKARQPASSGSWKPLWMVLVILGTFGGILHDQFPQHRNAGNSANANSNFPRLAPPPDSPPAQQSTVANQKMAYPVEAKRKGEQGTVTLRVLIDQSGHVLTADIFKSSGHASLDEAAMNASKNYVAPPYVKDGKPVSHYALLPYNFVLEK